MLNFGELKMFCIPFNDDLISKRLPARFLKV